MENFRGYFLKLLDRVGILGLLCLTDSVLSLIQAALYLSYGNFTKAMNSGVWGVGMLMLYFVIDRSRNKVE